MDHLKVKKKEELDRMLSKSKACSFTDMMDIKNMSNIFICGLLITFNTDLSRAHYPIIMTPVETYFFTNIFNSKFCTGILLLICGLIT